MANIKVTIDYTLLNGQPLTFKSPTDCSQVTGLAVCYPEDDTTKTKTFQFADAHGNNVGSIDLFASNVLVKVILDVEASKAYVQNADTNAYLERRLARTYVPHTMTASGWSDNTYSFEAEYPKDAYDISIEVAPTATAEQFEAFGGAMICGSAESNIATALGDVPTVDIPIIIKVVEK